MLKKINIDIEETDELVNFLKSNLDHDLSQICNNYDIYMFQQKYKIFSLFELIGICIQLYENDGIQNFILKLINRFYDIKDKNKIFYYITEKINILFPNFFSEELYNQKKVTISNELMIEFLRNDITCDLKEIPYISKNYEKILKNNGIFNSYQLLGKFLELDYNGLYKYLKSIGIHNNLHNIIYCIGEKCNILIPGSFNM